MKVWRLGRLQSEGLTMIELADKILYRLIVCIIDGCRTIYLVVKSYTYQMDLLAAMYVPVPVKHQEGQTLSRTTDGVQLSSHNNNRASCNVRSHYHKGQSEHKKLDSPPCPKSHGILPFFAFLKKGGCHSHLGFRAISLFFILELVL